MFAEVSLISSHAPWTPIPPVLEDWDAIGDGRVFSQWAEMGDPPEVVWRDPERVRHQYLLSVDYVLGVLGAYADPLRRPPHALDPGRRPPARPADHRRGRLAATCRCT